MATGYTAGVADGSVTSLREFALTCARGMGALITMRDEPHDAPIPQRFEPSSFYANLLVEAKSRLAELQAMSPAEREASAVAWNVENDRSRGESVERNTDKLNRYNAMLAEVVAWEGAPEGLKEFMLEQLRSSLDFDCSSEPLRYAPPSRTADEWFAAELRAAEWQIEWSAKEAAAEAERTEGRNAWLAQLRASLPAS